MQRLAILLTLILALLLVPALCTGGWLAHACSCGPEVACSHEADCSSDPCEVGIPRPDTTSSVGDAAAHSVAILPPQSKAPSPMAATLSRVAAPRRDAGPARPFPASDTPLLI